MADWQSFATGFLTSVGQEMDRKTEKAEEYEQRQRLLGERNRPAVQKRKQIAQSANAAVKQLSAMGIGSAAIFAAMKSNPDTGIFELQRNAQKAIEATQRTYNRNPTPEEFESFISFNADMPEELKGDSDALSRLTAQLYGVQQAPTQAVASSEGTGDSSFIRNIFGPSLQSVDEKLKAEQAGEGLSVYDLATYSDVRPYDPTSAGAFFSFQQPNFFNPNEFAAESRALQGFMTRQLGSLLQDKTYKDAKAGYDAALPFVIAGREPPEKGGGMRQFELDKEIVESKTAELLDMFVGSRAAPYAGSSYVDVMKPVLDDFVDGYVADFTSRAEKERAELEGEIPTATPADAVPEDTTTEESVAAPAEEPVVMPIDVPKLKEQVSNANGMLTQNGNIIRMTIPDEKNPDKNLNFIVKFDEKDDVTYFAHMKKDGSRSKAEGPEAAKVFDGFTKDRFAGTDETVPEESPSSDRPPSAVPVPERAAPVLAGFMPSDRDVLTEVPTALNPESVTQNVLRAREADNYDTLYGNFEKKKDSPVFDYKVTEKTLGELVEFSKPSNAYGKYVKPRLGKNTEARRKGLTSTPMGKYQIVGTTLKGLIKDMRLPSDLVFNKETQDAMFLFLARQEMQGKKTLAQKRQALKETWEGFRSSKVTKEQLNEMISEIESSYGSLDEWLSRNQKQSTEQE